MTKGSACAVEAEHRSRKGRKNKKARVLNEPLKADEARRGKGRMVAFLLKSGRYTGRPLCTRRGDP
jgi:hypothetical protein